MSTQRIVLITGAAGNLGGKLRRHLEGRHLVRLLDIHPQGDPDILAVDLATWSDWHRHFEGVDTLFHLAADPLAQQTWPNVIAPNLDALVNVFQAALAHDIGRVVFASSNHVMGGYKDLAEPERITPDLPPLPGTRYLVDGEARDSTAYAATKLFGERLGGCLAKAHGLEVVAARLGWNKPGDNLPSEIPESRGEWFQKMWLSNRDFCHLMERCLLAELPESFVIVNGMSNNAGMRWDLTSTRAVLGYEPQDDFSKGS
jgi:NAD+ dependent glucose-6-phosphate dehydrogenase